MGIRSIKFRGKRVDNGEWIKGDLLQIPNENWTSIMEQKKCTMNYIVDAETVGQYTGLKDCNGKEIYEGDIVRAEHNITNTWGEGSVEDGTLVVREEIVDSFSVEGDVCFEDGGFMVEGCYTGIFMPLEIEVIGNIHDNPELLEGAENDKNN